MSAQGEGRDLGELAIRLHPHIPMPPSSWLLKPPHSSLQLLDWEGFLGQSAVSLRGLGPSTHS